MCGFRNVWIFVCMCECFDNCVSVFVCVLVFIVFCIFCTMFLYCIVYVYLLFVLLPPSENSVAVSKQ
jgi:hypothetical protein